MKPALAATLILNLILKDLAAKLVTNEFDLMDDINVFMAAFTPYNFKVANS